VKQFRPYSICTVAGLLGLGWLAGCSSDSNNVKTFTQMDRLARPAVNEVFATIANNRHQVNDTDNPTNDSGQLSNDIQTFMTHAAGRSQAVTDVVKSVLVPDVLVADLSKPGPAAYLGVETNGATGGTFGGRKLTDDVVDISLGVIFGPTVTNAPGGLGLAADDGKEIPALTSDNVSATTAPKHFRDGSAGFGAAAFPYLGPPQ
jgi:hypothetical protein